MRRLEALHRVAAIVFYVVATVVIILFAVGLYQMGGGLQDWGVPVDPSPSIDCSVVRAPECS